ncbi:SixA phosphatase family protein [Patiriisocius hiemis]|uniref:Phosphoglycerate mutase family protein n=1 Tax=Patiriisocius hiemis TaxID=3075604 RepID=A0ABU2Y8R2_9FLAO|nr:phosphoglycerate mutase family protein [Constantimarinum sp. W242]MDT0554558.1 phosphoglycerate mutase family protein [Constantimarinum sp. W242]
MKVIVKSLFVLFIVLFSQSSFAQTKASKENTTYYLIRHAEKDKSDAKNRDPHLTEKGMARATRWAAYFKDKNIDAVYSTPYHRTKETALPTANSLKLDIIEYNPRAMYSDSFKKATKGKNVLIVGHSNTTPQFTNLIIGKDAFPSMSEDDNSSLYIVKIVGNETEVSVENIN